MKVCIIGAGSSGITAAKTLKEHGISFDCYEKGSNIGGNWRFNNDNGMSSAYRSLHINTNRRVMAYSDFPMPASYPMFPHHSHIIAYFEDYVDHFGIRPFIYFNTEVLDVARQDDGKYLVETTKNKIIYDAVVVCNGHHWNPRFPEPAFAGTFTGEQIHSHHYKESQQVAGKNVLVVGMGNSAVDIACEAARTHSGRVVISSRSGAYIVPNWIGSKPFDELASPLASKMPLFLQRIFLKTALWVARGNQSDYGVPTPNRPVLMEHPTLSQDLLNLAGRGLVGFKPNVREFRGQTVVFEDGTEQDFDLIVYATGYKVTFPFLKHQSFDVGQTNDLRLYHKVVHPDFENLFFVALIQPLGAIMPLAETQSGWIAKILSGKVRLPSADTMRQRIENDKLTMQKRYKASPRHTLQVDFFPYKACIENEIRQMKVV